MATVISSIILTVFGVIFTAMALAPVAIDELQRRPHHAAGPMAQPVAIGAHRTASVPEHGHESQAA